MNDNEERNKKVEIRLKGIEEHLKKLANQKKDCWDKIYIISSIIGSIFIPVFLFVLGRTLQNTNESINQLLIDTQRLENLL